jgi:hypothetical protein
MLQRIGRGWSMVKASWGVLRLHPKLMVLPILSGAAFLALIAFIGISVFAGSGNPQLRSYAEQLQPDSPTTWALAFAFYYLCSLIIIFFNAALVYCALQVFAGHQPSLRAGLSTAVGRLPQILGWALLATTVGVLLNAIESFLKDKLGFLGSLLGGLLAVGWAALTYFAVPVLVVDGVGPIEAVKRSSAILKKTWGEAASGEVGLSAIGLLFFLPVILLVGVAAASVSAAPGAPVMILLIAVVAAYIVAMTVVFMTLGTIFRTGAYIYATTGRAPSSMDPALLQGAFRKKA